jgi:hypothetical protein
VSFAATTLCVVSQRVFIVVDFVIDSVRKLLDNPSVYALSKSFRTAYLERELQMVQLSATRCSYIAFL